MNSKLKLRLLSLTLALFTVFSMTACSDDKASDGGEMEVVSEEGKENSAGSVSNGGNSGGTNNSGSEKAPSAAGIKFTQEYLSWLTNSFYSGTFVDAMNKTTFPEKWENKFVELEKAGKKRKDFYTPFFCPGQITDSVKGVSEYEEGKSYLNNVSNVIKNKNWIYNMDIDTNGEVLKYELMLSESKKALRLVAYDDQANATKIYEISETNDGYIAVCNSTLYEGKWKSDQLLFKAGEGYCAVTEPSDTEPVSIYETSLPAGFAGK